ncbi:ABC transporter ATP-binding protein [Plantibacter sp. Mn2098]|uniref:ABC transporter ATP-binding protein n=1 Tax=Plantibacter sp. Mn2098 TaxID=3395266 RepID=UPI003BD90949
MRIDAAGVCWGPAGEDVLHDVSVAIGHGRTVGVVGPNGSGKSSLLRVLAGLRRPGRGVVRYDGDDVRRMSARRRALRVAFLDQAAGAATELSIEDVVGLGRLPHRGVGGLGAALGGFGGLRRRSGAGGLVGAGGLAGADGRERGRGGAAADREAIEEALDWTGLTGLRRMPWSAVSGGEQQRAHLARALAQRAECLILDEPTNHLDIEHQLEILQLVRGRSGVTNVIALHDLDLAARYCDDLIVLQDGRVQVVGPPAEVLTESLVRRVFHVQLERTTSSSGAPGLSLTLPVPPDRR